MTPRLPTVDQDVQPVEVEVDVEQDAHLDVVGGPAVEQEEEVEVKSSHRRSSPSAHDHVHYTLLDVPPQPRLLTRLGPRSTEVLLCLASADRLASYGELLEAVFRVVPKTPLKGPLPGRYFSNDRRTRVKRAALSRVLDRLEVLDLIHRVKRPGTGGLAVELTDRGRAVVTEQFRR